MSVYNFFVRDIYAVESKLEPVLNESSSNKEVLSEIVALKVSLLMTGDTPPSL